jgi:zinc transport system permease protein
MNESLELFVSSWALFREPTLAGVLAGALLGYLGVFIVLRRMVFVSAALSQSAGLGVTLAFYAQLVLDLPESPAWPLLGAVTLTLLAAGAIGVNERRQRLRTESLLGAMYLVGAAGALALGTRVPQEAHDIESLLFGSAVALLPGAFVTLVTTVVVLLALHIWLRRGFTQASFDRDGALVRELPVRLLEALLLGSIAIAIATTTRILGALPVFAFSVLPAMAALRLVSNVPRALFVATAFGALSGLLGYIAAFLFELPVGASQTLCAALLVVVSGLIAALPRGRA